MAGLGGLATNGVLCAKANNRANGGAESFPQNYLSKKMLDLRSCHVVTAVWVSLIFYILKREAFDTRSSQSGLKWLKRYAWFLDGREEGDV
jgi:hypothetical protein